MGKVRKDKKGRVLHRGESFKAKQQLYCYAYNDPFGERKCIYAKDLGELREKEKRLREKEDSRSTLFGCAAVL